MNSGFKDEANAPSPSGIRPSDDPKGPSFANLFKICHNFSEGAFCANIYLF